MTVERFPYDPDAEYPDGGMTFESWTVGRGEILGLKWEGTDTNFLEMEVLSPLYSFSPGEAHRFTIDWGVCRCDGTVLDTDEGGCTSERLTVVPDGSVARVRGVFGVFDVGRLELAWRDATGAQLSAELLCDASPEACIHLNQKVPLPVGARAVNCGWWPRPARSLAP